MIAGSGSEVDINLRNVVRSDIASTAAARPGGSATQPLEASSRTRPPEGDTCSRPRSMIAMNAFPAVTEKY